MQESPRSSSHYIELDQRFVQHTSELTIPSLLDQIIRSAALSDIPSSAKRFLRQPTLITALFDFGFENAVGFEDPSVSLPLMAK